MTDRIAVALVAMLLVPAVCLAQGGDAAELAKQLSNPVASLISVPLQNNFEFGIGPDDDGFRYTLNVQPVIPISLTPEWNLISRTILPITYQDEIFPRSGDQFGLGDTLQSLFLSPAKPGLGGLIWGVGPVFLLPTGTDELLGGEKWGAGPTAVALVQHGPWTVGFLGNHVWSFAGDDARPDVDQTFLQPFVTYTFPNGFGVNANTETTYDWEREQWTVPIQLGVSKVLKLGAQPIQLNLNGRYWVERPDSAPEWAIRLVVVFLFPK
jgi:hypothetical protein